MEFDTSKLFGGHWDIEVRVTSMSFPFLIIHAFDDPRRRQGVYIPDALSVVLAKCCELMADDTANPEHLRDMLKRGIKAEASASGLLGLDDLPLEQLFGGQSYVNMTFGMMPTKIRLRRYGDCLAIQPVNDRDVTHGKMANLLARLAEDGRGYVRHFIQRYGFSLTPVLKKSTGVYVLNVQDELALMDRYLPDIKWAGNKRLAAELGADFTSHQRSGVKIGSYGDADIFAGIKYEREVPDQAWREGKIRNVAGNELFFGTGAGDMPQIEYSLQMVERESFDPARSDIDYHKEQGLLRELSRMIYAGLYQRQFQSMLKNGNEHWVRFRRESEQVAA